jgi:lysophospholipase L1-like esterase
MAKSKVSLRRKFLFLLIILLLLVFAAEGVFRLILPHLDVPEKVLAKMREYKIQGHQFRYVRHPYLIYTLNPAEPGINSLGFRGGEFQKQKPADVTRVACLGSSTTYCSRVKDHETYPFYLQGSLEKRTGRKYQVMNWGTPGWLSTESMFNYFLNVQDYQPDIVILCHAINDFSARRSTYRGDYLHVRSGWSHKPVGLLSRLLLRWSDLYTYIVFKREFQDFNIETVMAPPTKSDKVDLSPMTAGAFTRNMRTICEHVMAHGGRPVLVTMPHDTRLDAKWPERIEGIRQHNEILRTIAGELNLLCVDLESEWLSDPETTLPYFFDLVHVNPEGNRRKAETIAEALVPRQR